MWARLQAFARDPRGSIAIIFGLSMLPLTALAGAALDYHHAHSVNTKLNAAADAAALAGVRQGISDRRGEAWRTMDRNVAEQRHTNPVSFEVNARTDQASARVEVCYTAQVRTSLLSAILIPVIPVQNCVEARNDGVTFTEINILMDASGSMGIGATAADQNIMQTQMGCTFGCHLDGTDATARARGARMRFDVIRDAVVSIVQAARDDARARDRVRFNVYLYSNALVRIADSSQSLDTVIGTVRLAQMAAVGGGTVPNFTFPEFARRMSVSGSGSSSADPRRHALIFTDATENSREYYFDGFGGRPVRYDPNFVPAGPMLDSYGFEKLQGFNGDNCRPIKQKAAEVFVLHTPYVIPTYTGYAQEIFIRDMLRPNMEAQLRRCASHPRNLLTASDPADIALAVNWMYQQATTGSGVPRLVR